MRVILWLALASTLMAGHRHPKPEAHTPEPATIATMGVGIAAMAAWRSRRAK